MTVLAKTTRVLGALVLLATVAFGAADEAPAVEGLAVDSDGEVVEFTITSTEWVRYTYFELEGPRLVVDFHNAENRLGFWRRTIDQGVVERVRASSFVDDSRDATRIVFDMAEAIPYAVVDAGDGTVRVRFGIDPGSAEDVDQEIDETDLAGIEEEKMLVAASSEPDWNLGTAAPADGLSDTAPADSLGIAAPASLGDYAIEETAGLESAKDLPYTPAAVRSASASSVRTSTREAAAPPAEAALALNLNSTLESVPEVGEPTAVPEPVLALPALEETTFLEQVVTPIPTPQYTGEIVTLDLKDVDLRDFFRLIGEISGLNVILDPNVAGSLTLLLRDVPWDQALDVVLRNNSLSYELQGNILRVATQATLQAEEDARLARRDAQELNAELVTRTFILSYTQAATVSATIQDLLSPRGTIITDARRNALIVSDVPSRFGRMDSLVSFLDTPSQQVEIEARLLSANRSFSRALGSQIGLLVGNNSQNVFGGVPGLTSPVVRTPTTALGPSLPLNADFSVPATSGVSFLLGAGGDILLDAIITAAEARGTAKLLSRPRITTQNNQTASVSQGTQIPVQTNVNNTITTQFLPFTLNLSVTPQITEAETILLNVTIENSSPDFARAVNGTPSVSTQQAQTSVLIPDGGTAVIGGILIDNDSVNVRQVPGLGNIPVLGHLFKSTQVIKSTSELLFFVTARIKPANPLEFLPIVPEPDDQGATRGAPPEGIQEETPRDPGRLF